MSGKIAVHGTAPASTQAFSRPGSPTAAEDVRPHVQRTTARPVSAMQRGGEKGDGRAWVVGSSSRPTSGVQRGRIRPHSALARASGMHGGAATSSDDDLDDTYSVASTRRGKPSRASSPSTYTSGYNTRPVSAMSRPVSAMSRSSDVGILEEDDENVPVTPMHKQTVTRRYFTKDILTADGTAKMSHFSVTIPAKEAAEAGAAADKTSYLRIYYSDMLGKEPAVGPCRSDERTVEVDKMAAWLVEGCIPRSRVDAYPLLILTREILRRFISKDLTIVSKEAKRLFASLDLTNKALKRVQADLGRSIKENQSRDTKIKELQTVADQLPLLEADLKASQLKSYQFQAKNSELLKKAEDQKKAFDKKLEETKLAVKEKCNAANEKMLTALKAQVEEFKRAAQNSKEELAVAKKAQQLAEKNLAKEKLDISKQLKEAADKKLTKDDILKGLSDISSGEQALVLRYLMTHQNGCGNTAGSFLNELHAVHQEESPGVFGPGVHAPPSEESTEPYTPFLTLIKKHNLYANGAFNRSAYEAMSGKERWAMCMAMMVEHLYSDATHKPMNIVDSLLIPAMEMAIGHEWVMAAAGVQRAAPENPQTQIDLHNANETIKDLTSENEKLKESLRDLELQLEEARKPPEPVEEQDKPVEEVKKKESPKPKVDDWSKMKRPKALQVFKFDPKVFKGKTPQPARVDQMLQMFSNIYEGKAIADSVDDREGNARQGFPEFMRDWMINKFGLKSIALSNLCSLVMGIQGKSDDKEAGTRIRVFGHLSGIIPHDCWHEDLSNMIIMALGLLFQKEKISENMGHPANKKPLIEAALSLQATREAWEKYGFGKVPHKLEDSMIQMARREGGQLRLHEWLELLSNEWLSSAEAMEKDLRDIFDKNDTNGDGVLDIQEFRDMVTSMLADSGDPVDDRQILRLFAEAMEESSAMKKDDDGDDDCMQPEAFVRVARRARLYTPNH